MCVCVFVCVCATPSLCTVRVCLQERTFNTVRLVIFTLHAQQPRKGRTPILAMLARKFRLQARKGFARPRHFLLCKHDQLCGARVCTLTYTPAKYKCNTLITYHQQQMPHICIHIHIRNGMYRCTSSHTHLCTITHTQHTHTNTQTHTHTHMRTPVRGGAS